MNYKSSGKQGQGNACVRACVCVCICSWKSWNPLLASEFNKCLKMDDKPCKEEEGGKSEEFRWLALIYFANMSVRRAKKKKKHVGEPSLIWLFTDLAGKRCDRQSAERCITEQQAFHFVLIPWKNLQHWVAQVKFARKKSWLGFCPVRMLKSRRPFNFLFSRLQFCCEVENVPFRLNLMYKWRGVGALLKGCGGHMDGGHYGLLLV